MARSSQRASPRIARSPEPSKAAKASYHPREQRSPKAVETPEAVERARLGKHISWSFTLFDSYGAWQPKKKRSGRRANKGLFREVAGHLKSWEKRPLTSIFANSKLAHQIALFRLCKAAQDRLIRIKLDDQDALWCLHLTGKWRIWGLRYDGLFCVVWWDPEHSVYPVQKRHT